MFRQPGLRAGFGRPRAQAISAAAVVFLLSLLFAGAILSALAPHAAPDAPQAAIEGGL